MIFRLVRFGLTALALLVFLYLVAALVGAFVPGRSAEVPDARKQVEIKLISGPIHYDLLLPATPQTRQAFAFAEVAGVPVHHGSVDWIVVGWGAEAFYTTIGTYADIDLGAIWRGIIGDRAVLRVDVAGALPPDLAVQSVWLSEAQYDALLGFIAAERITSAPPLDHPGFSETDAFFPAASRFHGLQTCNVWIGAALRAAGVRFGVWTPTPYAVRVSLWWHAGRAGKLSARDGPISVFLRGLHMPQRSQVQKGQNGDWQGIGKHGIT